MRLSFRLMKPKADPFSRFLSQMSDPEFEALNAEKISAGELTRIADALAEMNSLKQVPVDDPKYRVAYLMERLGLPFEKAVCGLVRVHALEQAMDRSLLEILGKTGESGRLFDDSEEESLFQTAADQRFIRIPNRGPAFETEAFQTEVLARLARRGIHPVRTTLPESIGKMFAVWLPDRNRNKALN